MSNYMPYYPTAADHLRREAVPGPYHAVARGEGDPDTIKLRAIVAALREPEPMFMSDVAIAVVERVLNAYANELHVSGAPDRVVSNDATVRAAVDALNRVMR